ncbi:MAG: FAD-binding oxidoreductase [Proteobacteria bacterium]|nr:FAD-binding oxidoreductase [Pseudomonadota bacterium]
MNANRCLWSATAGEPLIFPRLAADVRTQVAIIGAGYTGLSTALHLAKSGISAVVLEALHIGAGGSGLNGGQVIPGVKHDPDRVETMFGAAAGAKLVATVAAGADLVFDLINEHGIQCDAMRTGWLQLANTEEATHTTSQRAQQWKKRGARVEILTRDRVAQLTGSECYRGGWIDYRGGTVQPLSYLRGLAEAARRLGSSLFEHSAARRLHRSGEDWRVETAQGSVTSRQLILATDAFSGSLVPAVRRSMVLVPSFQVATAPLSPDLLQSILPQRQSASDTKQLLRYFRLDSTGRLLLGTRGLFGEAPVDVQVRDHRRAVAEIYPQLRAIPFEYHWGGPVSVTSDSLPRLHEVEPGLLTAFGYNGRGVAMATVMGRLLAQWAAGDDPSNLGFPVTQPRPLPLHAFSQIGARIAVQYFRAKDGIARWRSRSA